MTTLVQLLRPLLPMAFLVFFAVSQLAAHAPEQSYIFLRVFDDGISGSYQINTDDLNKAFGFNLEKKVTEEDIAPYLDQIHAYYLERVAFASDQGAHPVVFKGLSFLDTKQGFFVDFEFDLTEMNLPPEALDVSYNVLFDKNPDHRGFLITEYNWKQGVHNDEANISLSFEPDDTTKTLDLTDGSVLTGFVAMIKSGMWHIYIGLDHILFLLALLLPAVVQRKEEEVTATGIKGLMSNWRPVDRFRPAFIYVLKIVTFFTIAHTITLSLAALQIVTLPSWFVESVIALSIALAALHNIKPFFQNETIMIAFGFGLFHGFGFASVLSEVGLRGEFMTYSLLGFNIGVEVCQVLIICAIFPVLYFLRNSSYYKYILFYGSILLILISLYWVVERVFDIDMMLDNYIAYKIKLFKQFIAGLFS